MFRIDDLEQVDRVAIHRLVVCAVHWVVHALFVHAHRVANKINVVFNFMLEKLDRHNITPNLKLGCVLVAAKYTSID